MLMNKQKLDTKLTILSIIIYLLLLIIYNINKSGLHIC